ncbi:MAG: formyltransferase family protein [Chloroflexota bacterium]
MKRRVVIIGRTGLAVAALEIVMKAGDEIVGVIVDAHDDGADGWQPSLRAAARRGGHRVLDPVNVNDPSAVADVAALRPEFLLSFQAGPILRAPLIATASVAALNLHYGPLPRYRGVAPIAWAIMNGETATGVTLHHIDPGVDSGPLVRSSSVTIGPDDTGRVVYDRCVETGITLFAAAWPEIRLLETVPGTPQDDTAALYYNRWALDFSERLVRWDDDCRRIADRMRAFIFPPFQYPEIASEGRRIEVAAVAWDRLPHRGRPGEIIGIEAGSPVVAAPGGRIVLRELRLAGSPLTDDPRLQPGARLS